MNRNHQNTRKPHPVILLSLLIACLFCINIHAAEEDWNCESCGTLNAAQNNFCGNCGTAKPNTLWICSSCGHENDAEANFCVNCGQKKDAGQATGSQNENTEPEAANTEGEPYRYGSDLLYWDGYTYTTGDDGIYRIDADNQFERILGIDAVANGIFATGKNVYFMKNDINGVDFLYVYRTDLDDCKPLHSTRYGSTLVGADEENVYYLEPSLEGGYNNNKDLIRYSLAQDSVDTIASKVSIAEFWNGGIVLSCADTALTPAPLMILGSDGNSEIVAENCSQDFWIDQDTDSMYYIKFHMTSDTFWDGAYLCCLDNTGNREIAFIEGDYITPSPCGTVSGIPVVSFVQDHHLVYLQINPADGSMGEMDLPENASHIRIFYDEYGNTYYFTEDYELYVWRGSEYRQIAAIPSDGYMLGISGCYVYYWRYNEENHPILFQYALS